MAPGHAGRAQPETEAQRVGVEDTLGDRLAGIAAAQLQAPTAGKGSNTDDVLDDYADAVGRIGRARFQAKEDEHRQGDRRPAAGQSVDYAGDDAGENRKKIL